ncbi:MAG: cytochrome c biogenesis protein CcsA [Caldimicrobium sp.]
MENFFLNLTLITYFIAWIGSLFYFKTLEKNAYKLYQGVLWIGFIFHLLFLFFFLRKLYQEPSFTFQDVLNVFSFLLVSVYMYFSFSKIKAYTFGTFFLPLPILFLLLGLFLFKEALPSPFIPFVKSFWFPLHALSSLLSHAFLLAGFISSIMYLLQEREIKKKKLGYFFQKLPPLHTLEKISEKSLYNGFFFLTMGILSGALWSELAFGDYWRWSPKEIITLSLWLIYTGMIHQRILIGWRGRRLAYIFVIGTLLWFFTFFVVNFYFKGFHTYG